MKVFSTVPSLRSWTATSAPDKGAPQLSTILTPRVGLPPPPSSRTNAAPTEASALSVTLQAPVPLHAPLQPVNFQPDAGWAARPTWVPSSYCAEQAEFPWPQLIPAGVLSTRPPAAPAPALTLTERVRLGVDCAKFAPTLALALSVIAQLPVPVQAPLQPVKFQPEAGVAVSEIPVPTGHAFEHCVLPAPHEIPAGVLATEPPASGVTLTLSVGWAASLKFAPTVESALSVTTQAPVPLQAPVQPAKLKPAAGLGVSVITVPERNDSEQRVLAAPHEIPIGSLVIEPPCSGVTLTVSVRLTGIALKVAVTLRAALIVTLQVPVPVHAPLQPAKTEPWAGVAVRVTTVPAS